MTNPVETAESDTSVIEVAKTLAENEIGSIVVTEDAEPVGIFTESDLVRLVAHERDVSVEVADCMSNPLVVIPESEDVRKAAKKMRRNGIKKLPVVDSSGDDDDGELTGIVTTTDISDYCPSHRLRMREK
ncbi:MAG: CBS domain-containing protein [Halobacteria archaeon]|nr:CBS domain-containing protein [Halobacteria archaeon]